MIKINLVKSRVNQGASPDVNINFNTDSDDGKAMGLLKLLLMAGFVLAAMYFRSGQIDAIQLEASQVSQQLMALQSEIEQRRQEASAKVGLEAEAKQLNDKLDILRNLSSLRLVQVKSLDFIQSIIPERVWLQSIRYTSEGSQFRITGFSTADEDITRFLRGLESSSYFTDIILLQSKEETSVEERIKSFEISFRAEIEN